MSQSAHRSVLFHMHTPTPASKVAAVLTAGLMSLTLIAGNPGVGAMDRPAAREKESAPVGRSVLRRLNRTEYENTLRDLLHLPGLDVRELLPDDGRAFGYDKSGTGLEISSVQMAKYMEAADAALDQAIATRGAAPQVFKTRLYPTNQYDYDILLSNGDCVFLKDQKFNPLVPLISGPWLDFGKMNGDGLFKAPGSVGIFRHQDEAFGGRFSQFSPVHSGLYRIRVSVWSYWWNKGEVEPSPRSGAAGLYYGGRLLGHFEAPSLKPTEHEIVTWLDPGEYISLNAASLWPIRVSETAGRNAGYQGPGVAVDWLEVEGPLNAQWPPASHRTLFGDTALTPLDQLAPDIRKPKRIEVRQTTRDGQNAPGPFQWATVVPTHPGEAATRLLTAFLPRAFRRPVKAEEVRRYTAVVTGRLERKASFEAAMRSAYRIALCSPDFLFLRESAGKLDDFSLASRLSYFLWDSMPDATLLAQARQGTLHTPSALDAQIERMLKDSKSKRFVTDFLDQWLDLRLMDATSPDRTLYPEYGPYLRDAMRGEAPAFFQELLEKDLPASNLIDSDFLFVNQRLAEHYGIPNVTGTSFRRVARPAGSHRGGFLTQAAVLKVTANGTTTSPVKRGAWVLRHILGRPPTPPPPNIPSLEPDVRGATTVREQLARHRASPSCAYCHARIDPPGFALESFDVIGGLRDRFRATAGQEVPNLSRLHLSYLAPDATFPKTYHIGYRLGQPVDASGETADGHKFADVDAFKKLLLADPGQSARNLVSQLTIYATGTPAGSTDRAEIKRILTQSRVHNYGVRSLIHGLVKSQLFLDK